MRYVTCASNHYEEAMRHMAVSLWNVTGQPLFCYQLDGDLSDAPYVVKLDGRFCAQFRQLPPRPRTPCSPGRQSIVKHERPWKGFLCGIPTCIRQALLDYSPHPSEAQVCWIAADTLVLRNPMDALDGFDIVALIQPPGLFVHGNPFTSVHINTCAFSRRALDFVTAWERRVLDHNEVDLYALYKLLTRHVNLDLASRGAHEHGHYDGHGPDGLTIRLLPMERWEANAIGHQKPSNVSDVYMVHFGGMYDIIEHAERRFFKWSDFLRERQTCAT